MLNRLGEPGSRSDASFSVWAKRHQILVRSGSARGHRGACVPPPGPAALAPGFPKECGSGFVFERFFSSMLKYTCLPRNRICAWATVAGIMKTSRVVSVCPRETEGSGGDGPRNAQRLVFLVQF